MITQQEKDELRHDILSFLKTDFTPSLVAKFVQNNELAKSLLRDFNGVDYEKEIEYLEMHDMSDINSVLDTPHMAYYDSLYGSMDPLPSFRIKKEDMAEAKTYDEIIECDNIFSHMLSQLEQEPIQCELKDILSKEKLESLEDGIFDCVASQIYYFEPGKDNFNFYFAHYYRDNYGSWDSNAFKDFNIYDFDKDVYLTEAFDYDDAFDAYIRKFANMYQDCCSGIPDTLNKEVFNGENAIEQLREYVKRVFPEVWNWKQQELIKIEEKEKKEVFSLLQQNPAALKYLHIKDMSDFENDARHFGYSDLYLLKQHYGEIIALTSEIEKRDKAIEQYQKQVDELNAYLDLERSKNKVLELELKKRQ